MTQEESLLKFPCVFPIKVMGETNPIFQRTLVEVLTPLIPDLDSSQIKQSLSKTGKYTSLTLTFTAKDKAHVDAVYQLLTKHPMVKMVF